MRAQRGEELANRIREKVASAEIAGKYNVEAARIAGPYRVSAAEAGAQGKTNVAAQTAAGQAANRTAMAARQRMAALTKQGRPGGLWNLFTNAGSDYDQELQQLARQAGLETESMPTQQGGGPSLEDVAAALRAQGIDPSHAAAILNDPAALVELGF